MISFVVELGHDSVELLKSEAFIGGGLLVDMGRVNQFKKVVVIDWVMELFGDAFELLKVNNSVLVLIIEREDPLDSVFGLGLSYS